jgi:hypothetical protein
VALQDSAGKCDAEANRGKSQGRGTPTMIRPGRPIRIMVGVPLAGTLADDGMTSVIARCGSPADAGSSMNVHHSRPTPGRP